MSALGLSGLVEGFKTCVEGLEGLHSIVRSLRYMGQDFVDLDLRLEETRAYLWSFGRIHDLILEHEQGSKGHVAQQPAPSWGDLVDTRLVKIKEHVQVARKIIDKYDVSAPASGGEGITNGPRAVRNLISDTIWTDAPSLKHAETLHKSRVNSIQNTPVHKKVKWLIRDKADLQDEIGTLEEHVQALVNLTMPKFWILMHEATATSLIKRMTDDYRLPAIEGSYTMTGANGRSRISQEMDALQFVHLLNQETPEQKAARGLDCYTYFPKLMTEELPKIPVRRFNDVMMGPDDERVLVEWKGYDPHHISREEIISRVSDVVAILNSPPSFLDNVLPSCGYFEDDRHNTSSLSWIGIVYRTSSLGVQTRLRSLENLLSQPNQPSSSREPTLKTWKPPLGDRFHLALRLAETLLSAHNCGWFHKGIRAENIAFFTASEKSVRHPYLLGWEYSRSADNGQKSEDLRSNDPDANLYQHPDYFKDTEPGTGRYRQEFDHYQLGCVLLEIGMWRLLRDIGGARSVMADGKLPEQWNLRLQNKAARLTVEMGEIYSKVVMDLLVGLNADGREAGFWDTIVLQLARCCA